MTTRYQIVDEDDRPVVAFGDSGAVVTPTYASMTEACLALIFEFPDHPELRAIPVRHDLPTLLPQSQPWMPS